MGTIRHVISIKAPLDRVWALWSDPHAVTQCFENFITEAREIDTDAFEVTYRTMLGQHHPLRVVETERVDKKLMAWKTVESPHSITVSVNLENAGAETIMTFILCFDPPGVRIGDVVAAWLKYPHKRLRADLVRLSKKLENP